MIAGTEVPSYPGDGGKTERHQAEEGMRLRSILLDATPAAIFAITADGVRRMVSVVAADGSVTGKPVELGPLIGSMRVIRSGIAPNDRVIVNGGQRVMMPGQKVQANLVKITQAPATAVDAPVTSAAPASTATASD